MTGLDYAILVGYFLVLIIIGVRTSRRQKNMENYFIGGRQIGTFSLMTLWMASWVGGASIVGAADKAYELGVASIWYPMGMAIGCVIFALTVAGKITDMGEEFQHITYPDFIEKHYGVPCRAVATVTTIFAYLGYTASQLFSAATIITMITGWSLFAAFAVAIVVVIFYSALGGYLALESTNRFQAMLILFGVAGFAAPVVYMSMGEVSLSQALPESYFSLGEWSVISVGGLMLSTIMTFFTSMDSYSRCFSAKSSRVSRNGTLMASLLIVAVGASVCYVGMGAKVINPAMEEGGSILAALMLQVFPQGVRGILLVAILAAIMSTASACMLTASANITRDIYQRFINPSISAGNAVKLSMVVTACVGLASAVLAWYRRDIIGLLFMAFTLNSAGLFLPTIAVFLKKWTNAKAAFWSMGLALVTVLTWYAGAALAPENQLFKVDPVWPGLAVSAVVFSLMNLISGNQARPGPENA